MMMQSISSLDGASEYVFPSPAGFHKPVRQIKVCSGKVETVLDTAKENLCPSKVRYIVLKTKQHKLLQDLQDFQMLYEEDLEEISIILKETEHVDTQDLKAKLLKKIFELSQTLQESYFSISCDNAEHILRRFSKFLSLQPSIVGVSESDVVKFIYTSDADKSALDIEFDGINDKNILTETIKIVDRKDIIKLELDRESYLSEATKIEIGDDYIKIEGYPSDVKTVKLKIYKALHVNYTMSEALDDDVVLLLREESTIKFCNEQIKQKVPNRKFLLWKTEGSLLYVVGKNQQLARTGLETIRSCVCTFKDDFSELTFPDGTHLDQFKDSLMRNVQGGFIINDTNLSNIIVATTKDKQEKTMICMKDFKRKFTKATKTIKCSAEKAYHLEASKEELKANLLSIEKSAEKGEFKVTAYLPEVSALERQTIIRKSYGLNRRESITQLQTQMQKLATQMMCTFKLRDNQVQVVMAADKIEQQQVDVIVNSVSPDLNIAVNHKKGVTYCINKAAGPVARQSLREKYPQGLKVGEVAVGSSGNLDCKELFHVVLKEFGSTGGTNENLRKVITTCLERAEAKGFTSIAFPAIAAGVNRYPPQKVAETFFDCIMNHVFSNFETVLRTIIIAILPTDRKVKQAFTDEMAKRQRSLTEGKLIEHPKWLCQWKVDVMGETEEAIEDFVKTINAVP